MLRIKSLLSHSPAPGPRANRSAPLAVQGFYFKKLLLGLSEIIYAKHLTQYLACSKLLPFRENTYLVSEAMPFYLCNLEVSYEYPYFHERKLRLREAKIPFCGYTSVKWQGYDINPGLLDPKTHALVQYPPWVFLDYFFHQP